MVNQMHVTIETKSGSFSGVVALPDAPCSEYVEQDSSLVTPVIAACIGGHEDVTRFLLESGADPLHTTVDGENAITQASMHNNPKLMKLLLDNGCSATYSVPASRYTPLHNASKLGHSSVCKLLLMHGAQVDATSKDGKTPLYLACKYGRRSVVEVLMEFYPRKLSLEEICFVCHLGEVPVRTLCTCSDTYTCLKAAILCNRASIVQQIIQEYPEILRKENDLMSLLSIAVACQSEGCSQLPLFDSIWESTAGTELSFLSPLALSTLMRQSFGVCNVSLRYLLRMAMTHLKPEVVTISGPPKSGKTEAVHSLCNEEQRTVFCVSFSRLRQLYLEQPNRDYLFSEIRRLWDQSRGTEKAAILLDKPEEFLSLAKNSGSESELIFSAAFMCLVSEIDCYASPKCKVFLETTAPEYVISDIPSYARRENFRLTTQLTPSESREILTATAERYATGIFSQEQLFSHPSHNGQSCPIGAEWTIERCIQCELDAYYVINLALEFAKTSTESTHNTSNPICTALYVRGLYRESQTQQLPLLH